MLRYAKGQGLRAHGGVDARSWRWRMMGPRKGDAMARGERCKCTCCLKLFRPDPRNRWHQRYCSAPACRAASKAASQARWLATPENRDYFRGPMHVARVRAWRSRHPGYWRRGRPLQDPLIPQAVDSAIETAEVARSPLQDLLTAQPAVLIGLIAHLIDTPLQDPIVRTTGRLLRLGQDILATSASGGGRQRPEPSR
jgi:hypothetical protein